MASQPSGRRYDFQSAGGLGQKRHREGADGAATDAPGQRTSRLHTQEQKTWADDVAEKKLAVEQKGEVYNDGLGKVQTKRFGFETTLCGYKLVGPIGFDHAMEASATVESAARDEGGEGDASVETFTSCVYKRRLQIEN